MNNGHMRGRNAIGGGRTDFNKWHTDATAAASGWGNIHWLEKTSGWADIQISTASPTQGPFRRRNCTVLGDGVLFQCCLTNCSHLSGIVLPHSFRFVHHMTAVTFVIRFFSQVGALIWKKEIILRAVLTGFFFPLTVSIPKGDHVQQTTYG